MAEKEQVTVELRSAMACRHDAPELVHRALMGAELEFPDLRVADFPDWFMQSSIQIFGEKLRRAVQAEFEAFRGMLETQAGLLEGQEPEAAARIWEGARGRIAAQPELENMSVRKMDLR